MNGSNATASTATGWSKIEQPLHLRGSQDLLGSTNVFLHDARQIIAGKHQPSVLDRHGIDVDEHYPGFRGGTLRDFVHMPDGRDARPNIEELAHAGIDENSTARRRNARFA